MSTIFPVNVAGNWTGPFDNHITSDIVKNTGSAWKETGAAKGAARYDAAGWPVHIPAGGSVQLRFGKYRRLPPGYSGEIEIHHTDCAGIGINTPNDGVLIWTNALALGQVTPGDVYSATLKDGGRDTVVTLWGPYDGAPIKVSARFVDEPHGFFSSLITRKHLQGLPGIRTLDWTRGNFQAGGNIDQVPKYSIVGPTNGYYGMTAEEAISIAEECGMRTLWIVLPAGMSDKAIASLRLRILRSSVPVIYLSVGNELFLGGNTNVNRDRYTQAAIDLWGEYQLPATADPAALTAQPGRVVDDKALRATWRHIGALDKDMKAAGLPKVWTASEAQYSAHMIDLHRILLGINGGQVFKDEIRTGRSIVRGLIEGNGGFARHSNIVLKAAPLVNLHPNGQAIRDEVISMSYAFSTAFYATLPNGEGYQPGDEADPVRQQHLIDLLARPDASRVGFLPRHVAEAAKWGLKSVIYEFGISTVPKDSRDLAEKQFWASLYLDDPRIAGITKAQIDAIKAAGSVLACAYHDWQSRETGGHGFWGLRDTYAQKLSDWGDTVRGAVFLAEWSGSPVSIPSPAPQPPPVAPGPDPAPQPPIDQAPAPAPAPSPPPAVPVDENVDTGPTELEVLDQVEALLIDLRAKLGG